MDTYIKDGIVITPGKGSVVIGDVRVFNPTEEQLKKAGFAKRTVHRPTLESAIHKSDSEINKETDRKILNDFTWMGESFYLTMENQFNFKNLYDLREMRTYPVLIKTKTGFMELDNADEVAQFYLAGVDFVDQCLKEGWIKKAEAEKKIREAYKD